MVVVMAVLIIGIYFQIDWLTYSGLILGVVSLFSDTFNQYFAWGWMKFARVIGTINSRILLTIIFYLFLTPLAISYRLISGNPLQQVESEEDKESYFVERSKSFQKGDFENPW